MRVDSAYVNGQLIHVLLFTPYNLVIKDFSNLEKFRILFSIVEGYHFEQINLSEYDDMETIEKVLNNLSSIHERIIIAFSNPKTEFLHNILRTKNYRFVLLVGSDKPIIERLKEHTGSNLLTYSIKNKNFTPIYNFGDLEYPNFILETVKTSGIKMAREQVGLLFTFTKKLFELYSSGRSDDCNRYLQQMGKDQLEKNVPQIETLFKVYYDMDISVSPEGIITEKMVESEEPLLDHDGVQFSSIEEEFGIVEPGTPIIPVTSNSVSYQNTGTSLSDGDDFVLQEKLEDVQQDLQERVDNARKEYMSVMRRVGGEFKKTLNHAIRNHAEKNPTVVENPTKPIEIYCELRCKSWYKSIPENILSEMLLYHVKNLMKVLKLSIEDPSFEQFLEAEQDKFLEAIVELPHESLHLQDFIDQFIMITNRNNIKDDIEQEIESKFEDLSGEEYIQGCINSEHISDLMLYEKSIIGLLRKKGKG